MSLQSFCYVETAIMGSGSLSRRKHCTSQKKKKKFKLIIVDRTICVVLTSPS